MATKKQTKAQRRAEAQARAEELRQAQLAKERRRRLGLVIGAVALIAIIAVVVVLLIQRNSRPPLANVDKPAAADSHGAFTIGKDGLITPGANGQAAASGVIIDVYYDYMCHACVAFESTYKTQIDQLVDAGTATLQLHPMNFLDGGTHGSSTMALAALAEVADKDPAHVRDFHEALLAWQWQQMGGSASGQVGRFTAADLTQIATGAGVSAAATAAFGSQEYYAWADATTENAKTRDLKVVSTPSIFLRSATTPLADAQRWQPGYVDTADLAAAVSQVGQGGPPPPVVTTPASGVVIPETTPSIAVGQ